ncbi:hypothetical protein HanPSC8_Chr13g0570601 [Helianthus annuus]|nr:hypothetical protein HanPSC8_Chr13g0570601 [Helianthus annuus]
MMTDIIESNYIKKSQIQQKQTLSLIDCVYHHRQPTLSSLQPTELSLADTEPPHLV